MYFHATLHEYRGIIDSFSLHKTARNNEKLAKFQILHLNKLERQNSSPDPSNVEGHAAIDNAAFESCDGGMKWSIINFKVYKAISEGFHLLAFLYVQNGNNSEIQCWEGTSQQFLSSFIFPGTSSVRTVTNSVLASHL